MSEFEAYRGGTGAWKKGHMFVMKWLVVLYSLSYNSDAKITNYHSGALVSPRSAPLVAPTTAELPGPSNLPHFVASKSSVVPAQSPDNRHFVASSQAPSSRLSRPAMDKRNGVTPPSKELAPPRDIAPTKSSYGTISSGLAQPSLSPPSSNCCKADMVMKRATQGCHCVYPIKLDLQLLNISDNPNWNLFLNELSSQLGLLDSQIELINFYVLSLSRLNISMDITPHTGISFSASDASAINFSLATQKVHLDPALVGGYRLLNLTWFEAPAPSPAPVISAPPLKAPRQHPLTSKPSIASKKKKHLNLFLIIVIGAGLLVVSVVLIMICLCTFRRRKETSLKETVKPKPADAAPAVGSLAHPTSVRFFAYEELKEATNNFEHASVLGEGGFGRVFKGVLSDGTTVAIKKLTAGGQQGDKEFLVEVEMLSRLHHRNLVKLVGYYTSRESSQNLLCYELIPNGSLEAWLHGPMGANCPLDWDTRMKIALDAARGLAYLHEDSQPCVIHRDFKASNILLENNFHAKVADFGLAKQAPEGRQNYLSTRVMGTFGYVAPEYAMTGHLLVKSDVYSYGVVLLELLTGRKPVDMSQPSGQENLVTWARPILRDKDRLEELVDSKLEGKYPKEDFVRVCTIAAACVAPEASQRPTMGEVVQSLKMVQRIVEHQDSTLNSSKTRPNLRQSSTTFESDGTSSMFSSGPFSGVSVFDNDNISRTAVFSEDLHEGR